MICHRKEVYVMGNTGSYSGQIYSNQENCLHTEPGAKKYLSPEFWGRSCPRTGLQPQIKVLPDLESRKILRHTNNGEILYSGGTLTGRHQTRLRYVQSRPYTPTRKYCFQNAGLESNMHKNRQNVSAQKSLNQQYKLCKSEPNLVFSSSLSQEMQERKTKKKYKAPLPPINSAVQENQSAGLNENFRDEYPLRRTRLFKTRYESKKELNEANTSEKAVKNHSEIFEEPIQARENSLRQKLLPELFDLNDSNKFKMKLKEATERPSQADDAIKLESSRNLIQTATELVLNNEPVTERRCLRSEPSGKESSTSESSLTEDRDSQKPKSFYFGMKRSDMEGSSCYPVQDGEENSTIALCLRPVLPRKPTQVPRFSPSTAWKLLDARSLDSGISGDARPSFPFSWTPQQDLGDDSSIGDAMGEEPRAAIKQRPHVFSLSLPRDHQPAAFLAMTTNKAGVSSLRRLKRSVLNTLSIKKEQEQQATPKEDYSNWFLTRSAPNSLNENSLEIPETCFPHISSTARLMYLPDTTIRTSPAEHKYPSPLLSKSCEELRIPESLRDIKAVWSKEEKPKKTKKFTFQSTVRQIERKRMADKLSKEAEKKEKQRLRELEAMQRVEEEFQRKRAKEKADIRQQLRLFAMDNNEWISSLPCNINEKTEERQEPDGALSSSNSSISPSLKFQEGQMKNKSLERNIIAQLTKELSEYREMQRNYKEYRGSVKYFGDNGVFSQTTVHPEVTCNILNTKGSNLKIGNYRKDFAYGIKNTKSMYSNQSEDSQRNNSPQMYRNKYSPVTRF